MSDRVACFWLEDLRTARYRLRRYAGEATCVGGMGYHNALSGVIAEVAEDPAKNYAGTNPPAVDNSDPRWPARCACGYAFVETDARQVFADSLYRRADTGEVTTREDAAAGAMWDANWWPDKGPGGICLMVKLPDGCEWMVDGPSANSKTPWSRTGTPPLVTARPSILTPGYHGFLTDGFLVKC